MPAKAGLSVPRSDFELADSRLPACAILDSLLIVPVIVATITPKPDKFDAVEEVLVRLIPDVHTEDGCELYALHKSKDRFVFVEKWRDMAALGAHGGGPNIKALNEGLKGLVAGPPDVQILEALPAGDAAKGAV